MTCRFGKCKELSNGVVIAIGVGALFVLIAVLVGIYFFTREKVELII